jgi:hypothetical protein
MKKYRLRMSERRMGSRIFETEREVTRARR